MEAFFESSLIQHPLQLLTWGSNAVTEASLLTSVLATLACGLFTVFLSTFLWRWHFENCRDPSSSLPLPPGSFGWPVVGETLHYLREGMTDFVSNRRPKDGVFKTHLLGSPMVRVDSDQKISQLASKEPHGLASSLPQSTRFIFGENGVSVVSGKDHASMKKNLRQAFAPVRLRDYLPIVQDCIRRHVTSWAQGADENKMLGFKACQRLVCDLILETVVGCTRDQDPDGKVREAFVICNDNMFCVPLAIPGTTFYKVKQARQVVVDFAKARIEAASSSDKDYVSVLDVLLTHQGKSAEALPKDGAEENLREDSDEKSSENGRLSEIQLIDNAVTIMLAGTDTVTSALCSILKLLGKYPEKLAAFRKELESQDLLDSGRDDDLSFELIQSMTYLQAVNKEVLRLLPPVAGMFRSTKKTVEIEGCQIPANWRVLYGVSSMHMVTEAFTDRENFVPERWLDPNLEKQLKNEYPCSYLPFGIGSRMCLGRELAQLEMSVFAIEVARLIDWTLLNPDARRVLRPIEKPFDDLPVAVRRRK
ncbi:hypothetical protein RRG08_044099 [Elysia crispata]|uniref:Cytochrome P450 n=1 Tax=Elysia crispata TaxID=231223 RepID=A0AAE0Z7N5_9GAST|nr:hypothetical protein RRG08_044099 [Elysia crispata]